VSLPGITRVPLLADLPALVDGGALALNRDLKERDMSSWMFLLDLDRAPGAPLAILPTNTDDPAGWALEHRDALHEAVVEHGAVLVRGLGLRDRTEVGAVFARLTSGLMTEKEAFAPRQRYPSGIYSSTRWPASLPMCMHHELSYVLEVPGLLLFACLTAPVEGGATVLADARTVLEALPPALVARFEREGWLLTRSYNDEIGATFAEAFGTATSRTSSATAGPTRSSSPGGPTAGCAPGSAALRWYGTPVTGHRCWFNQIAVLNQWTLDPEVREQIVEVYGEDGLPFNTFFGNGDPIDERLVALLNDVYEAHTVREPWQDGDLMLVDNIRTAHGREAYAGPREVYVGMADPVPVADLRARSARWLRCLRWRAAVRVISGAQVQGALADGRSSSWSWSRPPTGGTARWSR
jgi:alpha-ketoglutarate-dependent taurine dioxygenase